MTTDTAAPDMYERLYWEIQAVLDEVLGTDDDGTSEAGIVSDVRRALAKVRTDERESCAQLVEHYAAQDGEREVFKRKAAQTIAYLIRTRTT